MTTADELNNKFKAKLDNQKWQLDNAAGFDRLKDAIILGDEAKKNSCFGAVVSVVAVVGVLAAVFGSRVKLNDEPLCVCLEYIGDNGPCPVHGDPYGKEGQS